MAIPAPHQPERRRLLVEELEPRILYSADAAALLGLGTMPGASHVREFDTSIGPTAPSAAGSSAIVDASYRASAAREIIFVDGRIPDAYEVADQLARQRGDGRQFDIVVLSDDQDASGQISQVLSTERGLSAIHVVGRAGGGAIEGAVEGGIERESGTLEGDLMVIDSESVARWSQSLIASGELLSYGWEAPLRRHEIVFVDAGVGDAQSLIEQMLASRPANTDIQVVQMVAGADGLSQISAVLSGSEPVDALHIVSHGAAGQLLLGNQLVDATALETRQQDLTAWRTSLSTEADILLWGCNVAEGELGASFIGRLAELTGADLAASTDATGNAAHGGDWVLEASVGAVDTVNPFALNAAAGWQGLLANAVPVNTVPAAQSTDEDIALVFSVANGNAIAIADADAGGSANQITLSVTNGTLTVAASAGLTFVDGDGSADNTMSLRGTAAAINAALDGLSFSPTPNQSGGAALTLSTKDSVLLSLDIDPNLLGRYAFEVAGNPGTDSSPVAGHPAAAVGVIQAVDAVRGNVVALDGSANSNLQIPGLFGSPANVTLAAWVNLSAADVGGAEVLSIGDSVMLRVDSGGRLTGIYYDGGTWIRTEWTATLAGTGWHHVAFSFDDAADATLLYLDGSIVATNSTTDTIAYTLGSSTVIGSHGDGKPQFNFNGLIDDARIYDRVLTADEVATLAQDLSMTDTDTVAISVAAVNDAPQIAVGGAAINYTENATPTPVVPAFTAIDIDSADLNGGGLTVGFLAGGTVDDRLTITPGGSISILGNVIRHSGSAVATFSGGGGGASLVITFNTSSTATVVQDIARQIAFFNVSDQPSQTDRTLSFVLTDGDGGTSSTTQQTIIVSATPDAPIAVDDRAALTFDGIDDMVNAGSDASLQVTGASITMEAWVNPAAYNASSGAIVLNREGEYELGISASGSLQWAVANGNPGWAWHDTGYIVPLNTWTHLAVSIDNGVASSFVNGTLVDIYHGAGNIGDAHAALDDLRIGGRSNNPAGQYFNGQIDDVRVWNIARSQAQIEAALDQALTPQAGLIGHWRIDEGSGATTVDSAGTNQASLINGGAGAPGPQWAAYRTDQNSALIIGASHSILGNDIDGDGDPTTVSSINGSATNVGTWFNLPSGAGLLVAADGTFIYNPNGAFGHLIAGTSALDSFSYQVSDGNGGTDGATVTLTITGLNDAPALADGTLAAADEDEANPAGAAIGAVFAGQFSDLDAGASFVGVAVINNDADPLTQGSWQYSSDAGFNWFAIGAVSDDAGALALAASSWIRFVPVADFAGAPTALAVRALDDSHSGGFSSTSAGESRVLVDATMRGGTSAIAAVASGLATTIIAVNDGPTNAPVTLVAIAEDSGPRLITQADLLANASDIDGPALTAVALTITSGAGALVDNADGTWTYTSAVDDDAAVSFGYSVSDGSLATAGDATLDLTPVNDAPTSSIVTLAPIVEDNGARLITQAELLANATDIDGPGLIATGLLITSGQGSMIDNGDGSWTYSSAINDDTSVAFGYMITDGALSTIGAATLDITPVNDAPDSSPVTLASIAEDSGPRLIMQAELLGNAADIDGPGLLATGLAITSGSGSLVDNGDGTWTYLAAADEDTAVSFSYTITDGSLSVIGTATLDINPVNDAPTTSPITLTSIAEDSAPRLITQAELLVNASDIDSPGLTAANLAIVNGSGSLLDNGDGSWTYNPAPDDDAAVLFSYTITDGSLSTMGAATLDITPVNDAPTTSPVTLPSITEDSGPSLITQAELLGDATDIDGPGLVATGLTITSGSGSLVDNGDGTWAYSPAPDDHSAVSFSYIVTDGALSTIGAALLDITSVNDAPTTSPVTLTSITEDSGPRVITQAELLVNAADIDGPGLVASGLAITSGSGLLVDNGDGTWTYSATADDDTSVSFSYTITDGSLSTIGTATLDIMSVNDAPTTSPVTLMSIAEDGGPRLITQAELLGNATDIDGPGLTAAGLAIASGSGSLVDNGDGTWAYSPAADDDTAVSFSYAITDGSLSTIGTATLDITPVNDAPTTSPVTLTSIAEDSGPRLISQAELLVNATDIDSPGLLAAGLAIASGSGSLVDNGDGTWTYSSAADDDSSVSFSYTITDGVLSTIGAATIDITPVNDAPTTSPVTLTSITEDSGPRLITQAELLGNAADFDGPGLVATGLSIASGHGSLIDNGDGSWTYSSGINDDTSVAFSYTITDGVLSTIGTATLDITPVNDAPTSSPVVLSSISEDSGPRLITQAELLISAADLDGPGLTAIGLTISAGSGLLVNNGDGTWTYSTAADDDSSVSFAYAITDGSLSTTGTATLDTTPVNDVPTSSPVTLVSIAEDSGPRLITQAELLGNATDIDGPGLTAAGLTIANGSGSLLDNGDGSWTYNLTPDDDAAVLFSYTITDGSLSTIGTATLDITPVNDAPATIPVTLASIAEDSGPRLITQAELLGNAADIDGPGLTATGLSIASGHGSLIDNGDGSWTYSSGINDDTSVAFSYTITDGSLSMIGAATLDIMSVNDAPMTSPVTLTSIAEDSGPRLITQAELLGNATDIDGPSLVASGLTITSGSGSLADNGDGTWTYTSAVDDDTAVSFGFSVCDGSLDAAGHATLDLTPVNDAPMSSIVTLAPIVEDNGPRLITQSELLANATDIDGPGLTAAGLAIANGSGSLIDNGDGSWTYDPAPDDDAAVLFSFTITDGSLSTIGAATLDITPVNDAPTTIPVTLAPIAEDSGPRLISQSELLANAADIDGPGGLVASGLAVTGGSGSLIDNGDGTWTYSPGADDDTSVSFSYTVTDGTLATNGEATLDIEAVNDAPTAGPVTLASIAEDSSGRLITQAELLGNAADVDGPALTATGLAIASGSGSLLDNGDGTWSYTPAPDDDTAVTFSHVVTDGTLGIATSASLDITPVDDLPVISLAPLQVQGGARVAIDTALLRADDIDNDADALSFFVMEVRNGHFESLDAPGTALSQFTLAQVAAGRIVLVSNSAVDGPGFSLEPFDGNARGATITASVDFRRTEIASNAPAATLMGGLPIGSDVGILVDAKGTLADGRRASAMSGLDRVRPAGPLDTVWPTAGRDLKASAAPRGIALIEAARSGNERAAAAPIVRADDDGSRTRRASHEFIDLNTRVDADDYVAGLDGGFTLVDLLQVNGPGSRSSGDTFGPGRQGADEASDTSLNLSDVARAGAIGLTAGTVWWALRAGSLLTGLLVSLPAWRQADLLAVLPDEEDDDDWDSPEDKESARDERAVDLVFESNREGGRA